MYNIRRIISSKNDPEDLYNGVNTQLTNRPLARVFSLATMAIDPKHYRVASSSSGKYHNIQDRIDGTKPVVMADGVSVYPQGGNWVHSRKVAIMFCILGMANQLPRDEFEVGVVAALLHDSCKRGVKYEHEFTVFEHPLLVKSLISKIEVTPDEWKIWETVCDVIASHSGQWSTFSDKDASRINEIAAAFKNFGKYVSEGIGKMGLDAQRNELRLPTPTTRLQLLLHEADMLAAQKEVFVEDILGPPEWAAIKQMLGGEASPMERPERKKAGPATEKQVASIKRLVGVLRTEPALKDRAKENPDLVSLNVDALSPENIDIATASLYISRLKPITHGYDPKYRYSNN